MLTVAALLLSCIALQETVKGSQGAGKVDETLDRSKGTAEPEAKPAAAPKPQLPARPAGKGKPGRK